MEENNQNEENDLKKLTDLLSRIEEQYVQYENKLLSIVRAPLDRSYNRRRHDLETRAKVSARPLDLEFFQLQEEYKRVNLELKKKVEYNISMLKELEKKERHLIEAIEEAERKISITDDDENGVETIKRNLKNKEEEVLYHIKEVAISRYKIVS